MIARPDDRPKFRQDLLAESVEDAGQRFIDVMDPDSGNLFRFYEVEFSLACAMDGERDVTGIVKWAQEELGVTPSPAEVRTVIATLGELGYLHGDGRAPGMQPRPDELAPGVVVNKQQPNARSGPGGLNIELGAAGTNARGQDMPKAADVALGAAGAQQHKRVVTPIEDVPLGTPGRPAVEARRTPRPMPAVQPPADVSLDLADQMSVRPDDVKEAVRASKVMKAVDVPPELRDALENQDTGVRPGANEFESEQKTVPRQPTPLPTAARPTPQPQPATQVERPAHELRRPQPQPQPQHEARPPVTPLAPTTRWSTVILAALLIAVIGGAGAFLVWKYALKKSNDDAVNDKTSDQLTPKPVTPAPPPPPPPAPPAIKFATEPAPPVEIKAGAGANLEFLEAQKTVKKGDFLAKLGGHERLERVINENQVAIDKRVAPDVAMFKNRLETLQAANRPANEIKAAQELYEGRKHDLEGRQKTINEKQAELDKLVFKAPADGDFAPAATKPGAKVASGDTLGTFTPAPVLVATFKPDGPPPAVDSSVYVAIKGTEGSKLVCKVKSVDNGGVKVACPGDASLVDKEVTYGGPAPEETIEMPPEPSAGSGSASAGSATATPPPTPKQQPPQPKPPTPTPTPTPAPSGSGSDAPKAEGSSAG